MELALANAISHLLSLLFKSLHTDIENFFSSVQLLLQAPLMLFSTKWDHPIMSEACDQPLVLHQVQVPCMSGGTFEGEERIGISQVNDVMNSLGMVCGLESISGNTSFGPQDFLSMFEEEEPSLEEIRETFGVFDANNDGFIDASELQRVASNLGLKEGCGLGDCERMIKAFDGNGDGLIDFQEFLKFMERCLC